MTYEEVLENARKVLAPKCRVCPECNGLACKGEIPGCGGVASGRAFTVCREFFKTIKVEMDAVHPHFEADTSIDLFGHKFSVPFFPAPIGGMGLNYTNYLTEADYAKMICSGTHECGSFGFTGDGPKDDYFTSTIPAFKEVDGLAVPTMKPWELDKIKKQIRMVEEAGTMAFAMDIDSAALINLKLLGKPVTTKPAEELAEIASCTKLPFVVKGVMTAKSAELCKKAGAYGIVVSTHGGRILEDTPCPASKLQEIRAAVGKDFKIFVDGGIRTGADVFKCIALGADAVLIGRPYAIAAHGGGAEGVALYTKKIMAQLKEIMLMTDCPTLADITALKIRF